MAIDWNDPYMWRCIYRSPYTRAERFEREERRVDCLLALLPQIRKQDKILVVGCGHGWGVEWLHKKGYTRAVGCDSSTYLADRASGEVGKGVVIHRDDVRVLAATAKMVWDWVISEDMIGSYRDAEVDEIFRACRRLAVDPARVVHIVTCCRDDEPCGDSAFNWKSLEAWKQADPTAVWIRQFTWDMLPATPPSNSRITTRRTHGYGIRKMG